MLDLARRAVDMATSAGAQYAEARIMSSRSQYITAIDRRIDSLTEAEDIGIGIRVLADGAWGFAATRHLDEDAIRSAANQAVELARAVAPYMTPPVTLASAQPGEITYVSQRDIDPFSVPTADKTELLLAINGRLFNTPYIRKARSWMRFVHERRWLATNEGFQGHNDLLFTDHGCMAIAIDEQDARTRTSHPPILARGYEVVRNAALIDDAQRVAEQAVEHLKAPAAEAGVMDLVLDPLNLALTMHESVGHPTELDRALGFEISLAGGSFATPDKLNRLQYGSELVNFVADTTLPDGLATTGFDDEGTPCQRWMIVENGIFRGYSTNRASAAMTGMPHSVGSSRADHWASPPIVRIPNLSLMPGQTPCTLDDLVAGVDDGYYIEGMGSFSIDQMRQNFQFGGDCFWRIRSGKLAGMVKNITYQSITEPFWNACDAIADARYWVPNGVMNCGKGDPMQIARMTHGASPARFRRIHVQAPQ